MFRSHQYTTPFPRTESSQQKSALPASGTKKCWIRLWVWSLACQHTDSTNHVAPQQIHIPLTVYLITRLGKDWQKFCFQIKSKDDFNIISFSSHLSESTLFITYTGGQIFCRIQVTDDVLVRPVVLEVCRADRVLWTAQSTWTQRSNTSLPALTTAGFLERSHSVQGVLLTDLPAPTHPLSKVLPPAPSFLTQGSHL